MDAVPRRECHPHQANHRPQPEMPRGEAGPSQEHSARRLTGVVLCASHNIFLLNVFDSLVTRYPLTDFFATEFGVGLMAINVLMALNIWAHRAKIPTATPFQIPTSLAVGQIAK